MLFFEYSFDLSQNHLTIDKEVKAEQIGWKENDLFRVKIVDNQITLIRLDSLESFVHSKVVKSEVDK